MMIPPERIHQFINSNMPKSVIVICFCPPSFFLSSRIIFSSASLSYDPTILCFSSLPYVSAIFFLQNREVLKSALSEFSMAINQAFFNLTQKLCQVEQQPEAHAESTPMGCPGGEGGQAGPSTSKGTREVRSKRKHDILEESESSSDEESFQDYANFDSCDTEGDEDDQNSDGFGDDINSSQTEREGND